MKNAPFHRSIRKILLTEWDPIGVRDVAAAQDEYDAYVDAIAAALVADASIDELATHLLRIEGKFLETPPNQERARRVAEILHAIAKT